jgi:transaldolase
MESSKDSLEIKIFADGADLAGMIEMASKSNISGLTTNPTLMKKAKIDNYERFAKEVLREIKDKPISFEVFSDDLEEMKYQGEVLSSWGENVYVKVPVSTTKRESTYSVIEHLSSRGVKVNVTAIMTSSQVNKVLGALNKSVPSCVSVFAGRIADTGMDPMPIMRECVNLLSDNQGAELIWASPRELLNVFQAQEVGCHIITATNDILKKLDLVGKDLEDYSLETVQMFFSDAQESNYYIK